MALKSIVIYVLIYVKDFTHGQVNVALNNPTWQSQQISSSTYYSSSNAVDGLKTNLSPGGGQCAISAGQRSATWWVNLTSIYSIGEIWIYYRTDNNVWDASNIHTSRFLGFYVYISNTTERSYGHLCFHDTNYTRSTIPAVVNITCPVHGQYVIYYNERLSGVSYPGEYSSNAYNDLCEVEVLGCISGYYGSNCSLPCPVNCRYCHVETGECQWCEPGYQEYQCKFECNGGTYGQDCADRCGACLDYKQCHHINGSCLEGCDAGYVGNLCELGCSVGKFGYNCESYCSDKCGVPHRCNRATGECDGGCQSGWKGLQCSEECNDGRYGQKCADRCGTCLGYKQCHHINGSCLEGCDAGFIGEFCTTGCLIGKYGNNCSENCSVNCVEPRRCYGTTGECQRGCLQGWEGIRCDKVQTEEESVWQSRFYGTLGTFFVLFTANVFIIAYVFLKRLRKGRNCTQRMEELMTPVKRKPDNTYENSTEKVIGEYQELGELGKSLHYDALQKI